LSLFTLNSKLIYETQRKVFVHEIHHIEKHVPNIIRLIGINIQTTTIEKDEAPDAVLELISKLENRGEFEDYF